MQTRTKTYDLTFFRKDGSPLTVSFYRGVVAKVSLRAMTMSTDKFSEAPGTDYFIAEGMRAYTGIYDGSPVEEKYIARLSADAGKTKLATPAEMVYFTFLVQNVTRSWTHQAVRYRVGTAYIQQSMRVFGQGDTYKVLLTKDLDKPGIREEYFAAISQSVRAYDSLVLEGCPVEDARGILPHHILTSIYWSMSLSNLMHVYNTRMCCQAQMDEWPGVMLQMKEQVKLYAGDNVANLVTAPIDRNEDCGFHASIDKPCVWRTRGVSTVTSAVLAVEEKDSTLELNPGPGIL